jgi:hypothetical protein
MRAAPFVLALLLCVSSARAADDVVAIHNGFLTGKQYRDESVTDQVQYSAGLVDGMLLAPFFEGAEDGKVAKLGKCVEGMSSDQIAAIFRKYLDDHPERWHLPMHSSGYAALVGVCKLN